MTDEEVFELVEILQDEIDRLKESGVKDISEDCLYGQAVNNLGGDSSRFEGFFTCLYCGRVYHRDYSHNTDPDRDFCDTYCECYWLYDNLSAEYSGELYEDESLFPSKKIRNRRGCFWRRRWVFRIERNLINEG